MDRIRTYQDDAGEWRWQRFAPNGEEVGASTEGYLNHADMLANLLRLNGESGGSWEWADQEVPSDG